MDELVRDLQAREKEWKEREEVKSDTEDKPKKARRAAKKRPIVKVEGIGGQAEDEVETVDGNAAHDDANGSALHPTSPSKLVLNPTARAAERRAARSVAMQRRKATQAKSRRTRTEKRLREDKAPLVKTERRVKETKSPQSASPAATHDRKRTKTKGKVIAKVERDEDEEEEKADLEQQYLTTKRELVDLEATKAALMKKVEVVEQQVILKRYEINKLQAELGYQREMKMFKQRYRGHDGKE